MQQQQYQDEDQQQQEEEGHLYEEEQNHGAYENETRVKKTLAPHKKNSSKKTKKKNHQAAKIRSLNAPPNKKEPIYSQTVGYKSEASATKKAHKMKGQSHIPAQNRYDGQTHYQNDLVHNNHIVHMGYGEGIQEVDEDPASENEIMPKIEDPQEDEEHLSGKENQIYNVLSGNVKKAKQNLKGVPRDEVKQSQKFYSSVINSYIISFSASIEKLLQSKITATKLI